MKDNQQNTCPTGVTGFSDRALLSQVATDLDELGKLANFSLLVAFVLLEPQSIDQSAFVCQSDDWPSNQDDTLWTVYSENGNPSFEVNALSSQDAMREALYTLGWSVMKKFD